MIATTGMLQSGSTQNRGLIRVSEHPYRRGKLSTPHRKRIVVGETDNVTVIVDVIEGFDPLTVLTRRLVFTAVPV